MATGGAKPCPFEFAEDKRRVYVTFNWKAKDGPKDEDGLLVAEPVLDLLCAAGFEPYPWWDPRHEAATKHTQATWIFEFLAHTKTVGVVWDLTTRKQDNDNGTSKTLWHVAFGMNKKVVLYDALANTRRGGKHPALNYLLGNTLNTPVATNVYHIKHKNNILAFLNTPIRMPLLNPFPIASGLRGVFFTFDWKRKLPHEFADALAADPSLFTLPWWEPAFRHKPQAEQLQTMIDFFNHEQFAAFVWDVTDMERSDGTGRSLWHYLVGACMVRRVNATLIVLDKKWVTRVTPTAGSHLMVHPALCYMASITAVSPILGVRTYVVDSEEKVMEILSP